MEDSPTARALQALELLQARPGTTADALADRLGVSSRAARRYVAILREAGIPVHSSRGPAGGYRLGRGHRPPPLFFSADEVLGLVMAVLDGQHAADDETTPVGAAVAKLVRALPDPVAGPADTVRRHAHSVPRRGSHPDPGVTSALVSASADRRRVRFTYRSASGPERAWEVDPWAVVVRYGRWYLLCLSHRADAVRALRVDRIAAVERLAERFEPPADLDPVAALEHHLGAGWPYTVRVRFAAPYPEVRPHVPPTTGVLEVVDGRSCRLVGSTNDPVAYVAERLTPIPHPFTVEEGPELKAAVISVADHLRAAV